MCTLEKVKTKYMLFEPSIIPSSLEEAKVLVESYIDDMNDAEIGVRKQSRRNFFDEQITRLMNYILVPFGYVEENIECFGFDTGILLRHSVLANRFKNMFISVLSTLNEKNYVSLCRLTQFVHDGYKENYEYLETLRDSLGLSISGINYNIGEDTQITYEEVFREEFINILDKKRVKVKVCKRNNLN